MIVVLFSGCQLRPHRHVRVEDRRESFTIGSSDRQLGEVMGAPTTITLVGEIEYWRYGDSWVAVSNHRVINYGNRGMLRVEKLGKDGVPSGADIPDVKPPDIEQSQTDSAPRPTPAPVPAPVKEKWNSDWNGGDETPASTDRGKWVE